jgi:polysaccharide deacetylase 2 family uncharacterized protein YibQ
VAEERAPQERRPEHEQPGGQAPEQAPQPPERQGDVATPGVPAGTPERPHREAMIAIVIDDVGYSLENLREFLEFPGPIAFAVLPQLAYTRDSAHLVRQAGKELLLHLPMEALNGDDPGPGAILLSQSEAEIRRLVAKNFADLEGAVGANNHMGSRATADPRVMRAVMQYMADTGRFFLDSRTTPKSTAAAAAQAAGTDFLERDVFIDNTTDASSMRAAFDKGVALAQAEGRAVLIGHVYNPGMLDILREVLAEAEPLGVRLVPLSRLLGDGGSQGAGL